MTSVSGQFSYLLSGLPVWPLFLVLLVVSLLLIFFGRTVVRVLAFLVVGLIGAALGGMLMAEYLPGLGTLGSVFGVLVGFVLGGFVGLMLLALGIGLAIGYAAYLLAIDVVGNTTVALVAAVVFFILGAVLYKKILTVATAIAGGLLLFDALRLYFDPTVAGVVAALVTLVGLWFNLARRRRAHASPSPPPA